MPRSSSSCRSCGLEDGRTRAGGVECHNCRESGVRLSVVVQHHSARAALLDGLLRALEPLPTGVASDAEPGARPDPLRTYLAALRLAPAGATHVVVIQDDAEPCRDFAAGARAAIAERPDELVAFFVPRQPPHLADVIHRARDRDESFAVLPRRSWMPVVALSWPADLARDFLAFVAEQKWRHPRADDDAVGRFVRERDVAVIATVPSLVEHPDRVPSLVGRRPRGGRVAAWFLG